MCAEAHAPTRTMYTHNILKLQKGQASPNFTDSQSGKGPELPATPPILSSYQNMIMEHAAGLHAAHWPPYSRNKVLEQTG